jgi:hypothetical protein
MDPVQKQVGNARTIVVTLRGVKVRFSSISSNFIDKRDFSSRTLGSASEQTFALT